MHVTSVELNGFKSYQNSTLVGKFDPQFNAITGLNGSGKSNILDALCFVLGITQLSLVRVPNLTGFIYKKGQAGVTKAVVTVTFDNSDKSTAPPEYENDKEIKITREIALGGESTYKINGKKTTQMRVHNLFSSVGLNVNNPHFLIMQGRITQVLNMKPLEIAGLLKEASGVNHYDEKKTIAMKKLEKAETKLSQTREVLTDKLRPTLAKLGVQVQQYNIWNQNNRKIDEISRMVTAFNYYINEKTVTEAKQNQKLLKDERLGLDSSISKAKQELKKKETDIKTKLAEKGKKNVELESMLASEQELSCKLEKVEVAFSSARKSRESDEKEIESSIAQIKDISSKIENSEKGLEESRNIVASKELALQEATFFREATEQKLRDIGSNQGSLADRDEKWRLQEQLREQETEEVKQKNLLKTLEATMKDISHKLSVIEREDQKKKAEIERKRELRISYEEKVKGFGISAEEADSKLKVVQAEIQRMEKDMRPKVAELDRLDKRLAGYKFPIQDSKCLGTLVELLELKDPKFARALEVCAGNQLLNVVVETSQTATNLVKSGKLNRRYTFIPLDSVSSKTIDRARLERGKRKALAEVNGFAELASELLIFPSSISLAVDHVFGRTIICDSPATAKIIAFSEDIQLRAVTLDGDVYEPQGTLSGGSSNPNEISILSMGSNRISLNRTLHSLKNEKDVQVKIESELRDMISKFEELNELRVEEALTEYGQLQQSLDDTKLEIVKEEASLKNLRQNLSQTKQDLKKVTDILEDQIKNSDKHKKVAEKEVTKSIEAQKQADANFKKSQRDHALLEKEHERHGKNLKQMEQKIASLRQGLKTKIDNEKEKEKDKLMVHEEFEKIKKSLDEHREEMCLYEAGFKKFQQDIDALTNQISSGSDRVKAIEKEIQELSSKEKQSERIIGELEVMHSWIQSEKRFFGRSHPYEFVDREDVEEESKQLEELQAAQLVLSRKINKEACSMLGQVNKEVESLEKKLEIVETDRNNIREVIDGLETRKREAIENTWKIVNEHFGLIFSDLLPGSTARLDLTESKNVLDGLEVKVAFGKTWKDSLTELSGGQRSLLALSLILAMLRYKPAPMYILDEVDAALDLSHTQNIGQMIRQRFPESQFIVVSLKEGMFNNANVVFKTKFVDGTSTVTRVVTSRLGERDNALSLSKVANRVPSAAPLRDVTNDDDHHHQETSSTASSSSPKAKKKIRL